MDWTICFSTDFILSGETPNKHGNSYTFTQNSDTITETPDFCLIVQFFPQSPSYQRHPKTKKLGSTTHRDEPHQALKPLDFNPFFNTFAYEYQKSYGIIWKLPPGRLLMIVWTIFQKWPRGFTFLTTGFKLTMGCSFSLTTGFKCPLMRVQKWTPPLPTCHKFSDQLKSKQRIPATANVPESLVFSVFPGILFISFVSIKRFTFR